MGVVVLVVGRPASGKSSVAAAIAACFSLPVVGKDDLKEILFDSLGTGDRDWSRRIGRAAFDLLDRSIELMAAAGGSFVVDAAFDAAIAGPHLAALQERLGFAVVQVHCSAPDPVLLERFVRRAATSRHPGHVDADHVDEFAASLRVPRTETFALSGPVLEARADDDGRVDVKALLLRLGPLLPTP